MKRYVSVILLALCTGVLVGRYVLPAYSHVRYVARGYPPGMGERHFVVTSAFRPQEIHAFSNHDSPMIGEIAPDSRGSVVMRKGGVCYVTFDTAVNADYFAKHVNWVPEAVHKRGPNITEDATRTHMCNELRSAVMASLHLLSFDEATADDIRGLVKMHLEAELESLPSLKASHIRGQ